MIKMNKIDFVELIAGIMLCSMMILILLFMIFLGRTIFDDEYLKETNCAYSTIDKGVMLSE